MHVHTDYLRRLRPVGVMHVDAYHFVALVGYTSSGVIVADSQSDRGDVVRVWSYGQLDECWDGVILVVS